ncbi:hypothetical protein PC121_g14234 [Phytophthora cactorum]|nr:hypothetical protein PC121_g14234 [Phytophthora cactorum]KAG4043014.1 hypothetical protein PC123_g21511 [Phytophthora cactorum]
MMAHETAEQLRKLLSATVEPLQAEIKRLTATNVRLDALLQKTKESTFIAVDTALLLENLQKRKSYLLQVNRTLCSHVSLAGMDPDILVQAVQVLTAGALNLADLQLDQATFVALQRIQAEAADSSDPCALSTAMDSDDDVDAGSDSAPEDKGPIPTDHASSTISAAGLGADPATEPSTPKPSRRGCTSKNVEAKEASENSFGIPVGCSVTVKLRFTSNE